MTVVLSILLFGIIGLAVWASSDLPLINREIAINTRKTEGGPEYKMVQILSIIIKVFAVLFWIAGIIGAVAGGKIFESFF